MTKHLTRIYSRCLNVSLIGLMFCMCRIFPLWCESTVCFMWRCPMAGSCEKSSASTSLSLNSEAGSVTSSELVHLTIPYQPCNLTCCNLVIRQCRWLRAVCGGGVSLNAAGDGDRSGHGAGEQDRGEQRGRCPHLAWPRDGPHHSEDQPLLQNAGDHDHQDTVSQVRRLWVRGGTGIGWSVFEWGN